MPALQVRDFPDDLYEQLKAYAASQHRSIAQQTIVAVEQMLEAADAQHYWDGHDLHCLERRPRYFDFGPQPTADEIVAMIHEGREERDRAILEACGFNEELERMEEAR